MQKFINEIINAKRLRTFREMFDISKGKMRMGNIAVGWWLMWVENRKWKKYDFSEHFFLN